MKKKKLVVMIETTKIESGSGKRYPIKYGKPVIAINPEVVEKIIKQISRKGAIKC